ncbi:hypothetical protein ABZY90_00065 [Streptomyces sp. NPDC006422]|uniref:hypothetical protein n=1 Tax=unclassified Streptomyces TaxID=2593676 RepID=UPI0033BCE2B0
MPTESSNGDIHMGDVSGTVIVGDNNNVTSAQPKPQSDPNSQVAQQSSAQDQAAVFALESGTMNVTYNTEPEAQC